MTDAILRLFQQFVKSHEEDWKVSMKGNGTPFKLKIFPPTTGVEPATLRSEGRRLSKKLRGSE